MEIKNIISRSIAAIVLFVLFSCILERDFSLDTLLSKAVLGLVFGVLYGIGTWGYYAYKKRK
ncbi:hypothetical protein [Eudoraea chungangensis]|uniref:hypothetical protein n=1 Tax=Eudoraea chungangensis TaxID=1481905 RepID=UPI0023EBE0C3|nr:hypothetical protein [Eudoraea chungangensis]